MSATTAEMLLPSRTEALREGRSVICSLGGTALMGAARDELDRLLGQNKNKPYKTPDHSVDSLSALDNYLAKEGTADEAEAYRHIKNQWRTAFFEIAAAYGHKSSVNLIWDSECRDFTSGGIAQGEMLVNGIDDRLPEEQYKRTYHEGANGILIRNLYRRGFFTDHALVEISAIPEKKIPGVDIYDYKKLKYFVRWTEVSGRVMTIHSLSMVNCDMRVLNEVYVRLGLIGKDEWLDSTQMIGHPIAVPRQAFGGPEAIAQLIDTTMDPSGQTFLGRTKKPEDDYAKIEQLSRWRERRFEEAIETGANQLIEIGRSYADLVSKDRAYRALLKRSLLSMFAANPDIAAEVFDEGVADTFREAMRLENSGRFEEAEKIRNKLHETLSMPLGCAGNLDNKESKSAGQLIESLMERLGLKLVTCPKCRDQVKPDLTTTTIRCPTCSHEVDTCYGNVVHEGTIPKRKNHMMSKGENTESIWKNPTPNKIRQKTWLSAA